MLRRHGLDSFAPGYEPVIEPSSEPSGRVKEWQTA